MGGPCGSCVRGYFTLLHLPTTTSILSLIAVSSLSGPASHLDRFTLILAEAFFMVALTGNYLDETRGRPWRTSIPLPVLLGVGVGALVVSSSIGFYIAIQVGWWFLAFVAAWGFLTVSYSLELFKGRFHNTIVLSILVALASLGSSLIQNPMPTWLTLTVAILSAIIAGYGREHYESGKPAGRDLKPLPLARHVWRWLMFEAITINSVAIVIVFTRFFV